MDTNAPAPLWLVSLPEFRMDGFKTECLWNKLPSLINNGHFCLMLEFALQQFLLLLNSMLDATSALFTQKYLNEYFLLGSVLSSSLAF